MRSLRLMHWMSQTHTLSLDSLTTIYERNNSHSIPVITRRHGKWLKIGKKEDAPFAAWHNVDCEELQISNGKLTRSIGQQLVDWCSINQSGLLVSARCARCTLYASSIASNLSSFPFCGIYRIIF